MCMDGLRLGLRSGRCHVADNKDKLASEDSPQEMMNRLFTVAHLILHSKSYEEVISTQQKNRSKTQN
jgi:hypothetical protein